MVDQVNPFVQRYIDAERTRQQLASSQNRGPALPGYAGPHDLGFATYKGPDAGATAQGHAAAVTGLQNLFDTSNQGKGAPGADGVTRYVNRMVATPDGVMAQRIPFVPAAPRVQQAPQTQQGVFNSAQLYPQTVQQPASPAVVRPAAPAVAPVPTGENFLPKMTMPQSSAEAQFVPPQPAVQQPRLPGDSRPLNAQGQPITTIRYGRSNEPTAQAQLEAQLTQAKTNSLSQKPVTMEDQLKADFYKTVIQHRNSVISDPRASAEQKAEAMRWSLSILANILGRQRFDPLAAQDYGSN